MVKETFAGFINNLCLYFERRQPSIETIEQWYPDVENIPAECLTWISNRLKGLDTFPRNFPYTMKNLFYEWLDANPNKRAKEFEYGCPGCHEGFIQVSYFIKESEKYYNTMFRCDQCRPLHPGSMSISNAASLYRQGYSKPLGYLSNWKYANLLPEPDIKPLIQTIPVAKKSINEIVKDIEDNMEYPF